MKALIIGCNGQDGTLLSELLLKDGWQVRGTVVKNQDLDSNHPLFGEENIYEWDATAMFNFDFVDTFTPDVIFYLSGITSVPESWIKPALTFKVNTVAYTQLLEKLLINKSDTKVIFASSVEIFEDEFSINESSLMSSSTPYGISKIASTQIGKALRKKGLWVSNAILSNHESQFRSDKFVTGKIAKFVGNLNISNPKKLHLGNINIEKNWSSAQDVVRGLKKISEQQSPDDYILAAEHNTSLKRLIEIAFDYVGITNWQDFIEIDGSLFRTVENISKKYDISHAREVLGWKASTPPEVWMRDMVQHHKELKR